MVEVFLTHGPSGSQWQTGAAACVFWTGIPVKTLVDACGGISRWSKLYDFCWC